MAHTALQTQTLSEQIYERLVDMIADGTLRPGQALRAKYLQDEFGFTQTPLREALRVLASQGLVTYEAHCGYRVIVVTPEERLALFELREVLEGLAARKAAERASEEQLREIMEVAIECDEMRELDPDAKQRAPLDIRFHRLIAEASDNPYISEVLLAPRMLSRIVGSDGHQPPWPVLRDVLEITHTAVANAICSRDPEKAEAVMRAHIREGALAKWGLPPGNA
jgi:DNA-binding GntR family transcriptional regulator